MAQTTGITTGVGIRDGTGYGARHGVRVGVLHTRGTR